MTGGVDAPFLPYGRQLVEEDDIAAVAAVLRSDFLTQGPAVEGFERDFAARVGARHAVACANGTAALHLAVLALGLGPEDAVVVPSVTFLATANAARYAGAWVEFADVDPGTGLMGAGHARDAIARARARGRTVRALFPVHLAGQTAGMEGLAALAAAEGAALVEDACHALGSEAPRADGRMVPVGACDRSAMAVFSFHPVKTVAAGEGGMVTTGDDGLARALRRLRTHGMSRDPADFRADSRENGAFAADGTPNPWYYEMAEPGFNYRLSDIHAALARSQLGKLDRFVARRAELVVRYDAALDGLADWIRPAARVPGGRTGWHLYPVLIDFERLGRTRADAMAALRRAGIGTQVHYIPVHRQPYYRALTGPLSLPGADSWYARCLSLPLFAGMEPGDVDRVAAALAALAG